MNAVARITWVHMGDRDGRYLASNQFPASKSVDGLQQVCPVPASLTLIYWLWCGEVRDGRPSGGKGGVGRHTSFSFFLSLSFLFLCHLFPFVANSPVCWLASVFARVFFTVDIAWPNHLAVFAMCISVS